MRKVDPSTAIIFLILAALGGALAFTIPSCVHRYTHLALYAKQGQVERQLDAIREAELAYHHRHGSFVVFRLDRNWKSQAAARSAPWTELSWRPDGTLWCPVEVTVTPAAAGGEEDFVARARCDLDKDGEPSVFEASRHGAAHQLTPPRVF